VTPQRQELRPMSAAGVGHRNTMANAGLAYFVENEA
jgi:hypothetical protein